MRRNILLLTIALFCLASCNETSKEVNSLKRQVSSLQKEKEDLKKEVLELQEEVEGYKNSPEKVLANAKELFADGRVAELLKVRDILKKYHPESVQATQVDEMYIKAKDKYDRAIAEAERKVQAQKEAEKKKRMMAVNKLKKKYDDVSDITWYHNPYFTHYTNSNHTSIYMGKKGTSAWLRLKMSYYGDDWIFFEQAFLSYDGNTQEIPFDKYQDKKSDNDSETWEWIDITVDDNLLSFLQDMVKGKNIKMRLSGKYTKTRNLSTTEINGIKDVLLAYDVLSNGE